MKLAHIIIIHGNGPHGEHGFFAHSACGCAAKAFVRFEGTKNYPREIIDT